LVVEDREARFRGNETRCGCFSPLRSSHQRSMRGRKKKYSRQFHPGELRSAQSHVDMTPRGGTERAIDIFRGRAGYGAFGAQLLVWREQQPRRRRITGRYQSLGSPLAGNKSAKQNRSNVRQVERHKTPAVPECPGGEGRRIEPMANAFCAES